MKVAVVTVDQVVWVSISARIATEYNPASESESEAANAMMLPDSVIRVELGPVTVI